MGMSPTEDDDCDPLYVTRFVAAVSASIENVPLYERRDWLETFLDGLQVRIERTVARQNVEEYVRSRLSD
jgi:hypothetical protein